MPHIYNCDKMMRKVTEPSFPTLLSDLKAACDVTTDINKNYPTIANVNDIAMGVDIVPKNLRKVFVKKINRSIELHETVKNKPKESDSIDSPADQLLLSYFKMSLDKKMSSREMNNSCINDWAKKEITPVTLPILLVDTTAGEGVMAQLTLWNTERESSPTSSAFIPAPSSYMLLCEATFLAGFNHVQTYIQGLLNEKPMRVIVWDLKPLSGGDDLLILEGQSASAAIAVGTLCAMREYFQFDERLHTNLGQIDTKNAAISASFTGSGHLDRVEGLKEKIQAIEDYNKRNRGSLNQVYVSENQQELFEPRGFQMTPCGQITNLVEALAKNTNAIALFGEYPHVIDALHNKANQSIDFYADFTGRAWLKDKVVAEIEHVLASEIKGGIVSLVAPAGWGKTAFALHLLEAAASENALPIHGYAFVRREAGQARNRFKELTSDASTIIRQLNNGTRHFLNMPSELGTLDTKSILETLLKDCGDRATPAHPIHLLFDAADELTTPLSSLLPDTRWPANVVLLVTARVTGLNNIGDRANRPFRTLTIGDESSVESAMSDIEAYIERRNKDIQSTHGISIESIKQAILNACRDSQSGQYYFLVAHGLLVDRPNLVADIDEWVKYPDKLPTGVQDYINKQIERALERASQLCISQARISQPEYKLTREDLELITESSQVASIFVLHFIAISETSWCTQDVTALINKLFSLATQNSSIAADLAVFGVDPADKIKLPLIFRGLQDLFGTASNEYQANFIHTLYRETIVNQLSTTEKREALHRLLGMLCEACWIKPEQSFSELIVNYALRDGVIHLAKGQQVLIAAKRLLDFNANETGYLDKLYQILPKDALSIVMRGIQQTQRSLTNSDKEWVIALDSLRFVLSENDLYLQSKEVDLLPTLYNAMAGYFTESTELGQQLLKETIQFKKPWMKSLTPNPADAFGPITYHLHSPVIWNANTENGEWLAAGLTNGEVWIWSKEEYQSGGIGQLVITNKEAMGFSIIDLQLVSSKANGFVIAIAGDDGFTRIQTLTRLRDSLFKNKPITIKNKINIERVILLGDTDGFVVALIGEGLIQIQTQKQLEDSSLKSPLWEIEYDFDAQTVRLVTSKIDGFIIAVMREIEYDHFILIYTRTSLENTLQKDTPWRFFRQGCATSIAALLDSETDGFIIASGGKDGTKIQTRTRLEDPLLKYKPWEIKHPKGTTHVELLESEADGFIVVSVGEGEYSFDTFQDDYYVKIQTRTRLEDTILRDQPWRIKHNKFTSYHIVRLLSSETDGFIVAIAGTDNTILVQTRTRLENPILTNQPWEIKKHKDWIDNMELMLFGVEGFVIAATCNDDTTVIHTCTYLEGSLLKLQSLAIQEKCRIVRGTNGFIVCSFGVDGSIRVRTSTSLRSWPVANYKWIMQHESRVYRAALLHSDSDGFIIASGGEDGTKVQTRARLEDPLLKNHPWKMSNIDDTPFYYDVALLNSTMDGFVVASLDNYGVKIQTRRRFEDSLLESITGDIRLSTSHDYYHIALMHHENDGFSVAIERSKEKSATQTHVYHLLPAGQVKNKYFSILSTKAKVFRCFQSLSNALFRNGFSGLLYKNNNVKQQHNYSSSLEVDEPLAYYVDDFLLSSHYEEYRHTIKTTPENTSCVIEHNATSRDISALRSDTDGYIVASAGPDGSTQINKLKRLESSILKNGLFSIQHKHHIIKRSFIKLMDGASFLSVIDASYQFYLFDFNEESNPTLLISQKIPHCISYAQFWRDEKIHFYVAYQIPEGVAITEYQLQNV